MKNPSEIFSKGFSCDSYRDTLQFYAIVMQFDKASFWCSSGVVFSVVDWCSFLLQILRPQSTKV